MRFNVARLPRRAPNNSGEAQRGGARVNVPPDKDTEKPLAAAQQHDGGFPGKQKNLR